jgi:lipoprotein-anchoring transpeptidase ErfK/SrfK
MPGKLTPLLALFLFIALPARAGQGAGAEPAAAKTWRLATISAVREAPAGRVADIWNPDTLFTARQVDDDWLRISGTFPGDTWQPLPQPLWVPRHYASLVVTAPAEPVRSGPERYIVVNKRDFRLQVFERRQGGDKVVYQTTIALGMDDCKPKELGGRCYYTEPGEYSVRWKVHDPQGIEWCIPKYMEDEYAEDIANGQRCFRGAIGTHALNIGKSYAIHGTSRPDLLGQRVSRGCVRAANKDMRTIYTLMDVGDKVTITE